nr:serine/threonine-protein phosphatase 6 regulatory ankyrin repeat subunit A-like [Paramormyrops kingsleyae]
MNSTDCSSSEFTDGRIPVSGVPVCRPLSVSSQEMGTSSVDSPGQECMVWDSLSRWVWVISQLSPCAPPPRPLHVAARNGLTVVVQELLGKGASVLAVDENGYTPALACAPNKDVADCLALILATMMPVSPSSASIPSLGFNAINHYSSPSKTVTFDTLPTLRTEHSSYCNFNNVAREDGFYAPDDELNDSDSETY